MHCHGPAPSLPPSQIGALQGRLESLREEKHRLFQQLKMVLHEEEDERKKSKESEDKQ